MTDGRILVIDPGKADRFSEGVAAVNRLGKITFLRTDGTVILRKLTSADDDPRQYRFHLGMTAIPDGMISKIIDKDGQPVETFAGQKKRFSNFSDDGIVRFQQTKNGGFGKVEQTYGFCTETGESLVTENGQSEFEKATDFSEGLAWIYRKRQLENYGMTYSRKYWELIGSDGKPRKYLADNLLGKFHPIELKDEYEEKTPSEFHDGWSRVSGKNSSYYISPKNYNLTDESAERYSSCTYFEVASDFSEGIAVIKKKDEEGYYLINKRGKYLRNKGKIIRLLGVDKSNDIPVSFKDGLIRCKTTESSDQWIYLDHWGKPVEFGGNK